MSLNKLIYVDETGIDNKCYRKECWAKKGEKIYTTNTTGKQYIRTTLIGALRHGDKTKKEQKQPISLLSFIGTTDKETFIYWVQKHLLPKLRKNDTVIMDNAAIHKSIIIKELIESKKAKLIYQPPYSPFLETQE
jgi:hypothetical protein